MKQTQAAEQKHWDSDAKSKVIMMLVGAASDWKIERRKSGRIMHRRRSAATAWLAVFLHGEGKAMSEPEILESIPNVNGFQPIVSALLSLCARTRTKPYISYEKHGSIVLFSCSDDFELRAKKLLKTLLAETSYLKIEIKK